MFDFVPHVMPPGELGVVELEDGKLRSVGFQGRTKQFYLTWFNYLETHGNSGSSGQEVSKS